MKTDVRACCTAAIAGLIYSRPIILSGGDAPIYRRLFPAAHWGRRQGGARQPKITKGYFSKFVVIKDEDSDSLGDFWSDCCLFCVYAALRPICIYKGPIRPIIPLLLNGGDAPICHCLSHSTLGSEARKVDVKTILIVSF